jgi:hypothetical protein
MQHMQTEHCKLTCADCAAGCNLQMLLLLHTLLLLIECLDAQLASAAAAAAACAVCWHSPHTRTWQRWGS